MKFGQKKVFGPRPPTNGEVEITSHLSQRFWVSVCQDWFGLGILHFMANQKIVDIYSKYYFVINIMVYILQ